MIVAVDDPEYAVRLVQRVREVFPHLKILARARDMTHAFELKKLGVHAFERELREGALTLGSEALRALGYGAFQARWLTNVFRDHDADLFRKLYRSDGLENRISLSQEARDELEKVFAADERSQKLGARQGWD